MSTEPVVDPVDPATPPAPVVPPTPPAPDEAALARAELARERQARLDAENRLKAKDEEALRKSKNWEELAKIKEDEANTAQKKYDLLQGTILQNEKISRLKTECLKLGINPEALNDLDLMVDNLNITVEATSTGKILVHGAESAAQLLKAKRPFWFTVKPASVNPASPVVTPTTGQTMTLEKLKALEVAMQKNPSRESQKAYADAILQFKRNE